MAQGTNIEVRAEMHVVDSKNVLAMGDVYLDQNIVLHNVRLVQTEKDGKVLNFVSFPQKQRGDKWEPVVIFKDADLKAKVIAAVKEASLKEIKRAFKPQDIVAEVRIYEMDNTRGYASVTYADAIQLENIRIQENDGKLSCVFPFVHSDSGFQTLAGPAHGSMYRALSEAVLKEYQQKKLEYDQTRSVPGQGSPREGGQTQGQPGQSRPGQSAPDQNAPDQEMPRLPWDDPEPAASYQPAQSAPKMERGRSI